MRDPGPTIVRTIIVNRQPNGLVVTDDASNKDSPTLKKPTDQVIRFIPEQPSNRPTITVKSIDISQARRHEVARPWLHSSIIQNPARPREFDFEAKPSSVPVRSTSRLPSLASDESKSERFAKWNSRVSNTQLQPVDFLLANSDFGFGFEKGIAMERKRILATDAAISSYPDTSCLDSARVLGIEPEIAGNPLSFGAMLLGTRQSKSRDPEKDIILRQNSDDESFVDLVSGRYWMGNHPGVATARETWKNMVRSASESPVGQALLATLSTIAVQQPDINAFGTKSAWELVTKPVQNSPL